MSTRAHATPQLADRHAVREAVGADPERDITAVDTGSCRTVLVGMEHPDHSVEVARKLVEQHDVQLIELCGGFGPVWTSRVLDASGHTIPVGQDRRLPFDVLGAAR